MKNRWKSLFWLSRQKLPKREEAGIYSPWSCSFIATPLKWTLSSAASIKHDANKNTVGHVNDNHILNKHIYDIKFSNSKVTAKTANAIAKSMYTQCNIDINNYWMLEEFVNTKCIDKNLILCKEPWLSTAILFIISQRKVGLSFTSRRKVRHMGEVSDQMKSCAVHIPDFNAQYSWTKVNLVDFLYPEEKGCRMPSLFLLGNKTSNTWRRHMNLQYLYQSQSWCPCNSTALTYPAEQTQLFWK